MYRVNLKGYDHAWTTIPGYGLEGEEWEIDDIIGVNLPLWIKGYDGDDWSIRDDIPEIWNICDLDYEASKKVRPHTAYDFRPLATAIKAEQMSLFKNRTKCDCKADLVVRLSGMDYTTLHCLNPYCFYKTGYAFSILLKNFGAEGVGDASCLDVAIELYNKSRYEKHEAKVRLRDMLNQKNHCRFSYARQSEVSSAVERITEYSGSLAELIKMSGLPYIGDHATKFFTKELLDKKIIRKEDLRILLQESSTKLSVEENMWCYIEDIQYLYKMSQAKDLSQAIRMEIAITGSVKGFRNKDAFMEVLNVLGNERGIVFVRKDSVTRTTQFLITDSPSNSAKAKRARDLGTYILTSQEFLLKFRKVLDIDI